MLKMKKMSVTLVNIMNNAKDEEMINFYGQHIA